MCFAPAPRRTPLLAGGWGSSVYGFQWRWGGGGTRGGHRLGNSDNKGAWRDNGLVSMIVGGGDAASEPQPLSPFLPFLPFLPFPRPRSCG